MESRITILNELREISPKVAEINNLTPYQAPAGYFEGLAEKILLRLKNPYSVPQGYFESLPDIILKKVKAQQADSPKEELEILSPLLSQIGKKTPFSTPAGYFDELTDNAVAGARAIEFVNDELENLSPVMNALKGKQTYEVPTGYFENLPAQVLNRVKSQQPAKVVSMNFGRRIMKYAAAAVIAGGLIIGGWFYLGRTTPPDRNSLAGIEKVSVEEMQNFLDSQDVNAAGPAVEQSTLETSEEIGPNDMKDMLADVSDAELEKYLDQYSNPNNSNEITN